MAVVCNHEMMLHLCELWMHAGMDATDSFFSFSFIHFSLVAADCWAHLMREIWFVKIRYILCFPTANRHSTGGDGRLSRRNIFFFFFLPLIELVAICDRFFIRGAGTLHKILMIQVLIWLFWPWQLNNEFSSFYEAAVVQLPPPPPHPLHYQISMPEKSWNEKTRPFFLLLDSNYWLMLSSIMWNLAPERAKFKQKKQSESLNRWLPTLIWSRIIEQIRIFFFDENP